MGDGRICLGGERVFQILSETVSVDPREYVVHAAGDNLFLVLVGIILSQNTTDKNSIRALESFRSKVGESPEDVLKHSIEEVEEAIRVAGGYRRKARAIVGVSRILASLGGESFLRRAPASEIRRVLSGVKGIGRKTIDVFLSFTGKERVFPVDTHAQRIAYRWGLVPKPKDKYEIVSRALAEFFGENVDYERAHKLIIAFGREYCKARNPRCSECPLRDCCPFARRQSS